MQHLLFFYSRNTVIYLLTIVTLFISTDVLNSQNEQLIKGYFIDKANNQKDGYFDLRWKHNGTIYFYHHRETKEKIPLSPTNISEIKLEDNTEIHSFELSYKSDKEYIFIQNIISGKISLFHGSSSWFGDLFFIKTIEHPEIIKINQLAPKTFLENYFKDHKQCVNQKIRYEQNSLIKAIEALNDCVYNEKLTYVQPNDSKISIGVNILFQTSKPQPAKEYNAEFNRFYKPGIGIYGNLNFTKNFRFTLGLNYIDRELHSRNLQIKSRSGDYLFSYKDPVVFNVKLLENHYAFSFGIGKIKNIKPMIKAGGSVMYKLKVDMEKYYDDPPQSYEGLTEYGKRIEPFPAYYPSRNLIANFYPSKKPYFTYFIGIGFIKNLKNSQDIEFGFRFIRSNDVYSQRFVEEYNILNNIFELSCSYDFLTFKKNEK